MEIQELWRVFRQRWRVVVVVTLICVCLSLAWSLGGPVSYRAQGRVMISTSGSLGTASDALNGEQVSVDRAPTYAQLLRGPEVAARASQKLQGLILGTDDSELDRCAHQLPAADDHGHCDITKCQRCASDGVRGRIRAAAICFRNREARPRRFDDRGGAQWRHPHGHAGGQPGDRRGLGGSHRHGARVASRRSTGIAPIRS